MSVVAMPEPARLPTAPRLLWVSRLWMAPTLYVWHRMTVQGTEHLPSDRPFILCSNHQSHMDSGALLVATGRSFSDFTLIAAKDIWSSNSFGARVFRNTLKLLPIDRDMRGMQIRRFYSECARCVAETGSNLLIFPEGTRSRTGAPAEHWQTGAAGLAFYTGLPIVPAYLSGTFKAMPPGKVLPRPFRVSVRFGRPLEPEPDRRLAFRRNACEDLTRRLKEAILGMAGGMTGASVPVALAPAS